MLAVASGASALHGGVDVENLHPAAFTPGETVRLNLSEPDDDPTSAYLATEIVVHAPTVDGTKLAFDASGAKARSENWTVVDAGSAKLRYSWNGSGTPKPPGNLTVAMADPLDEIEGTAEWHVDFCVRVADVQHCPDDHDVRASNVYDNLAPSTTSNVTDPRNNTASPLHQTATVTLNTTDGGSGVDRTVYRLDDGPKRVYDGPINITSAGVHVLRFQAIDNVSNRASQRKSTYIVVDGLAFAAVPGQVRAGNAFSIVARFAEDVSRSTTLGVPGANYPIDVGLHQGPASLGDLGVKTAQDGIATYKLRPTKAGTYVLEADHPHLPNVTSPPIDVVAGPLSRISVSPASTTVQSGGTVAFQAAGFDAYNNSVAVDPTWAASCGNVTQDGQFIASTTPGTCTVVASDGPIKGAAQVHVQSSGSGGSGGGGGSGSSPTVADLASSTHPVATWVNATQFEVTWSAPGAGAAGYAHSLAEGGLDPGSDVDTKTTSATLTVPGDGNWTFTVKPVFGDGSTGSAATYGPILVDTQVPVPPGQVDATADKTGATVTWQPSQDDGDSPVSSYLVLRRGPGDDAYDVASDGTVDGTTFQDADVQPGATYRYRVAAIDAAGNRGPPAKAVAVQIPEDAETSASGTDDRSTAALAGLYEALGVEPGDARLVDRDGDGTAETLTGDPRLTVVKNATVNGQTALLVGLGESSPKALVLTGTGQAHELGRADAEVGGQKLTSSGVVVTAQVSDYDGWALVTFEDPLPDTELKKVLSKDGETIGDDRIWRVDGQVVLLDDGASTYILQYAKSSRSRSAAGGQATPGPSLLLGAVALAGAALVLRRRRP